MRWWILLLFWLAACNVLDDKNGGDAVRPRIDHLVLAVADLDEGIERIERATGVRAQFGGAHPGRGTHNALLSLGPRVYLEILAPDREQANPSSLESLGLSESRSSRLVAWAINEPDLEGVIEDGDTAGFPMIGPTSGERQQADGSRISWSTASFADPLLAEGLAPFFIDWEGAEHPAQSSPKGVRLVEFRAEHPSPQYVQPIFDSLEISLVIEAGAEVALVATLDTPHGRVELR